MTEINDMQRVSLGHDHLVWINGLRAGRDSMHLCLTLEEAEAQSPYLIDGADPLDAIIKKENA